MKREGGGEHCREGRGRTDQSLSRLERIGMTRLNSHHEYELFLPGGKGKGQTQIVMYTIKGANYPHHVGPNTTS